jgi:hypothetical protein
LKKDGIRVLTLKIKSSTITNSKYDASQYGFYLLGGVGSKEEAVLSTRGLGWSDLWFTSYQRPIKLWYGWEATSRIDNC